MHVGNVDLGVPEGNFGTFEATAHSTIENEGGLPNNADATVEADGWGAKVEFLANSFGNYVDNMEHAKIEADDHGQVVFRDATVENAGLIEAKYHGTIDIDDSTIDNAGGTIAAFGAHSAVVLDGVQVHGGTLTSSNGGVIEVVGTGNALIGASVTQTQIQVPAAAGWYKTGVTIGTGDALLFKASGIISIGTNIQFDGNNVSYETPSGDPQVNTGTINPDMGGGFLAPGLTAWSLVGEVGDGTLFEVGTGATISMTTSGELYLGVNDNYFGDNSGYWSVTILDAAGSAATNSGLIQLESGATLELSGLIDNQGTIDVDQLIPDDGASLSISGIVVLEGGGKITLDGADDNIVGASGVAGGILINWDNTISGAGEIGGGALTLSNSGTIDADISGGTLTLDPTSLTNTGTLEATNGATLVIDAGALTNDGTIEAVGAGSEVVIDVHGSVAAYGAAEALDGGKIEIDVTGSVNTGIPEGNFGINEALAHSTIVFEGGLPNNADAIVEADGWGAKVEFLANDFDWNTIDNAQSAMIEATDHGQVDFRGATVDNAGLIEAKYRGTVDFDDSTIDNDGGTIAAIGHGSTVTLDNTTIDGGTLQTGWSGEIEIVSPTSESSNSVTFQGASESPLTIDGFVQIDSGANLELIGTIDNDGTINVGIASTQDSPGDLSDPALVIDGTVYLDGSGSIILNGNGDNIVGASVEDAHNDLINSETISGAGTIGGSGTNLTLTNDGTIDANFSGANLTIDTGHTINNTGTLEATDGGTLTIDDNVDNTAFGIWSFDEPNPHGDFAEHQTGTLYVGSASSLTVEGSVFGGSATIDGGTLTLSSAYDLTMTFDSDVDGTLVLSGSGLGYVADSVSGLASGDMIDLTDITYSHAHLTYVGDTLIVSDGNFGPSVAITLDGNYTASDFVLVEGTNGSTDLIYDPPPTITGTDITSDSSETGMRSGNHPTVSGSVDGTISFTDQNMEGYFTASVLPEGHYNSSNGTFSITSVTDGSVDWSFDFSDVKLSNGSTLTQTYAVTIADHDGAAVTQNISVTIGGANNDTFVFQPGIGADTIVNFNASNDTIELENFTNVQHSNELAAAITTDAHGDAVIELGHGDSITVAGVSATQLSGHVQIGHNII